MGYNGNNCTEYHDFPSHVTYSFGCAFKGASANEQGIPIVSMKDGSTAQVSIYHNPLGTLTIYAGGILRGTASYLVGTWCYLEAKVTVSNTVGELIFRVNGQEICNLTGIDTQVSANAVVNRLHFWDRTISTNDYWYFDDLWVCDGSGPAPNNGLLGDCRVEALFPSGVGATSAWTRGGTDSGANWSQVDEAIPNDDTDYNKSNTIGQTDTYAMTDLVSTTGIIYGVQKMNYVRKDNAGGRSVAPVLRIGGTDYAGTPTSIGDSYAYTREIEEISPSTLAAFTISEVNALEAGIVVTA